jgi:hypothetical protein
MPTVPAINLTGTGIDLHSGHTFNALMAYNGSDLTLTLPIRSKPLPGRILPD